MLEVRKSEERGVAEHGWLSSRHSFSFAGYHDPSHVHFGPLRVINEDRVQGGKGFGAHSHRDMEIISYVLDGELEHKDSMGTGSVIQYGHVQRMSAGSGVEHSEFNHSSNKPVHFLQIWILPDVEGIAPSYEEKYFDEASKAGQWRLIASPDGREGSVRVHQDTSLYATILNGEQTLDYPLQAERCAYVHVARGSLTVNGISLNAGDALKVMNEPLITASEAQQAEVLLFDLPIEF